MIDITSIVDESRLYGDDHHERCLEYIQRFFERARYPYVRSAYAVGSVVTGDYVRGHSDIDIVVITEDTDLADLTKSLRALNDKLWIPTFHVCKPRDFPPPDLLFAIRMLAESQLLYGEDVLGQIGAIPAAGLRAQIAATLSHRLVILRSLCCSKAVEKFSPEYTSYYCLKFCLLGLRALLAARGDWDTRRKHVLAEATDDEALLGPRSRDFLRGLLRQIERQEHPGLLGERVALLRQAVELLEQIQSAIALEA